MEQRKQKEVAEKLAKFAEMEEKVKSAEAVHAEKEHYRSICAGMYENGIIKQDENGTFIAVEDPLERESIRSKSKAKHSEQINSSNVQKEFDSKILEEDEDGMEDLE